MYTVTTITESDIDLKLNLGTPPPPSYQVSHIMPDSHASENAVTHQLRDYVT